MKRICCKLVVTVALLHLYLPVSPSMAEAEEVQLAQLFGGNSDSESTVRLDRVEEQMRFLTGQIEEMTHQLREMQNQVRQLDQDIDYRLQVLEAISGVTPSQNPNASDLTFGNNSNSNPVQTDNFNNNLPEGTLGQLRVDPQVLEQITAGTSVGGAGVNQPLDLNAIPSNNNTATIQSDQTGPTVITGAIDPNIDSDTLYDQAYSNLLAGNFSAATVQFEYFVDNYAIDPLASDAMFWLGDSYFAQQLYREAANAYLKNYTDYPGNAKVSESLLKLGLSLRGMGETETACATFTELLAKFPEAPISIKDKAKVELERVECT